MKHQTLIHQQIIRKNYKDQFVTSKKTVNESNKKNKTFYKTQPDNSKIDPTKLKKGQI